MINNINVIRHITIFSDAIMEFSPSIASTNEWNAFIQRLHSMPKHDYIAWFNLMTYDVLFSIYEKACDVYYNAATEQDECVMKDSVFDDLETTLNALKLQEGIAVPTIGVTPREHQKKATLPYFMPSMNKIKYNDGDCEKQLTKWLTAYPNETFLVSDKLDGVSCLYEFNRNKEKNQRHHLYTRGNGIIGTNIDHFIDDTYMPSLALFTKFVEYNFTENELVLRGELILPKKLFNPAEHGSNGRNFVSGVINSKTVDPSHSRLIHFVFYEVVSHRILPSLQMKLIETLLRDFGEFSSISTKKRKPLVNESIKCVSYKCVSRQSISSKEALLTSLNTMKPNSDYECDGIIVVADKVVPYSNDYKNPSHAFAFKNDDEENYQWTTVTGVEWNVSKNGLLKPIVRFVPVSINNVTIECATGFNAAFIVDNGIGVGVRVCVKRSGDVIPIICDVDDITRREPLMPPGNYEWNDTHKDIRVVFEGNENDAYKTQHIVKQLHHFTKKLGVKHLGESNIEKCVKQLGITGIYEFCLLSKSDWLMVDGVQEKNADKFTEALYDALNRDTLSLPLLMDASNCFGGSLGEKKLKAICDNPTCCNLIRGYLRECDKDRENENAIFKRILETLTGMTGFGTVTINEFIKGLKEFCTVFVKLSRVPMCSERLHYLVSTSETQKDIDNGAIVVMKGSVVFTGFRDKTMERQLESRGYNINNTISKTTTALVVKDKIKMSSKMTKATQLGIPIYTCDEALAKLT